jgi:hypothetical protein
MQESDEDIVVRLHREAAERARREGWVPPPPENRAIPYTDLPQARPDSPLFVEWDTYRREVARLLAEGREGQFVLIKGQQLVGLFASEQEALGQGYQTFPGQAFLVHQVCQREPLLLCLSVQLCPS